MKKSSLFFFVTILALILTCTGFAEGTGKTTMDYRTEEIRCQNGADSIYGIAYIPDTDTKVPLVIFSHELGNNHESGIRYVERLTQNGYAAYVFDFRGGSAPETQNRSSGTSHEMSVRTEASDLEAVLEAAKNWSFVDSGRIFLLGGSQGGLVTIITGSRHQDEIAGMMLMYPALSAKEDHSVNRYHSKDEVPEDVGLFGGWMHVGSNYITDLWDIDFNAMLASYSGKVLLLHGDRDGTVPLRWSEDASQIIPDCEFHVISGGGHEFFGQPFEEALTYILSYLDSQIENQTKEVQTQMKMRIGDTPVEVAWENNESVEALKELAQNGLTIQMSMYGGFEQVGSIGQRLPSHDVQTNTSSGDIVLYSSSQLVVFYGSNSWAYTRLGRITDQSSEGMRELLCRGDVTITISVE